MNGNDNSKSGSDIPDDDVFTLVEHTDVMARLCVLEGFLVKMITRLNLDTDETRARDVLSLEHEKCVQELLRHCADINSSTASKVLLECKKIAQRRKLQWKAFGK